MPRRRRRCCGGAGVVGVRVVGVRVVSVRVVGVRVVGVRVVGVRCSVSEEVGADFFESEEGLEECVQVARRALVRQPRPWLRWRTQCPPVHRQVLAMRVGVRSGERGARLKSLGEETLRAAVRTPAPPHRAPRSGRREQRKLESARADWNWL